MKSVASKVYLSANLFSLVLYAVSVTRIAHEMRIEHRHGADGSDMVTFAATALPIVVVFAVANLFWAVWAITRLMRCRERQPILLTGAALGSWLVVLALLRQFA